MRRIFSNITCPTVRSSIWDIITITAMGKKEMEGVS